MTNETTKWDIPERGNRSSVAAATGPDARGRSAGNCVGQSGRVDQDRFL